MSIPTGLLPTLRRLSERNLPDTCTVTTTPRVRNDSGGWTNGTPVSSDVACRLVSLSGRERVVGGRLAEESDAVIWLPDDTEVAGSDTITHDGTTYEVVDVIERSQRIIQKVAVRAAT